MKLTKVRLMGVLAQFGEEWELYISTPAEAIRAIGCQCPGFIQFLSKSHEDGIAYQVITDDPLGCDEEALKYPFLAHEMAIAPIIQGAGGLGRALLGVALIGAAFLIPGGILGISSTTIGLTGAALVLGGVSQLLTPTPKTPDDDDKAGSFLFDSVSATTTQGVCVPVLIGRRRINCRIVLSAGIDIDRIVDDDDD